MTKAMSHKGESPSRLIDARIRELGGWRGPMLARLRAMIREADPGVVEEWKWNVPVWSLGGIICTGEAYKHAVKLTFARGAALNDPSGLFNSSLEGNTRRAIDVREGERVHEEAFKALVRAAVALNRSGTASPAAKAGRGAPRGHDGPASTSRGAAVKGVRSPATGTRRTAPARRVLLAGGNPQVAKADGNAPVQAYIEAMPGWKRDVGHRLDALVVRAVPDVRKAVKWNSPFYGREGQGWFLSFHVFTHYVKVTFFQGTSLRPVPPGGTGKDARWIDIREQGLDEAQMASWVKQAAALPGWMKG